MQKNYFLKPKLLFLIFGILFFKLSFAANILFLSYDYGDANAFKELLPELTKDNINYEIIAIGKAKDLFNNNILNKATCLKNFDNQTFINDRAKLISKENLACLKQTLKRQPDIIVSGMSSAALAEILNSFNNTKKTAYYDNFDPYPKDDSNYYAYSFIKTLNNPLDQLFIAAGITKKSFKRKRLTKYIFHREFYPIAYKTK